MVSWLLFSGVVICFMYWIVSVNTVDYKKVQFRLHYIALACLAPSPPVTHRSVAWSCAMSDRLHNFCLNNRQPKYEFGHQPVQCCMLRIPQAARIALASQDRSRWWGGECMFALYAPPRVVAGPGWVKGSNMQNISLSDVVARAHVNTGSGGSQPPISRQAPSSHDHWRLCWQKILSMSNEGWPMNKM